MIVLLTHKLPAATESARRRLSGALTKANWRAETTPSTWTKEMPSSEKSALATAQADFLSAAKYANVTSYSLVLVATVNLLRRLTVEGDSIIESSKPAKEKYKSWRTKQADLTLRDKKRYLAIYNKGPKAFGFKTWNRKRLIQAINKELGLNISYQARTRIAKALGLNLDRGTTEETIDLYMTDLKKGATVAQVAHKFEVAHASVAYALKKWISAGKPDPRL